MEKGSVVYGSHTCSLVCLCILKKLFVVPQLVCLYCRRGCAVVEFGQTSVMRGNQGVPIFCLGLFLHFFFSSFFADMLVGPLITGPFFFREMQRRVLSRHAS